ncbi:transmembrane protein C1orf162 homolog isoform X2 [Bos javanicus]|uniref:transmembrane protein C1orf162 homolog isoform X2 n=1 Tax=Bos javanicus TaxID=9906 RepID=UPI002AA7E871|nr:transmembrane protein C1orf162 homolog isoform X2 [Bos javanicus]
MDLEREVWGAGTSNSSSSKSVFYLQSVALNLGSPMPQETHEAPKLIKFAMCSPMNIFKGEQSPQLLLTPQMDLEPESQKLKTGGGDCKMTNQCESYSRGLPLGGKGHPLVVRPSKSPLGHVPFLLHNSKEHLVLAFFAGVILTLLLMAFVFLIIKSCRKCPMGETCSSSSWHLQQVIPVPRPWILLQIIQPSFHPQRRYIPMPA